MKKLEDKEDEEEKANLAGFLIDKLGLKNDKGHANIILVVYDITIKDSFTHTEHWVNETKDLKREDAIFVLIGNKIDLESQRVVSTKEGEDFATEKGFIFHEVSAKTGEGIENLFLNKIFPEMARKFNIGNEEDAGEGGAGQENANNGIKLDGDQTDIRKKGGCCGGGKKKNQSQNVESQE